MDAVCKFFARMPFVLKLFVLSLVSGALGGLLGAVFHHALSAVTNFRLQNPNILFLLPLGGLATVALYRGLRLNEKRGTRDILRAVERGEEVSLFVAPAIFFSTLLTHLFGGSAGREGAALQLGGSSATVFSRVLGFGEDGRRIAILCGMSATFAGLFGTPFTAFIFVLEIAAASISALWAVVPCFISAFAASKLAAALGAHATHASVGSMRFNFGNLMKFLALAALLALLGIAMCYIFKKTEALAEYLIKNAWLRAVLIALVIIVLTVLVGNARFSGAGMEMAMEAVAGRTDSSNFILKIVFTALTLSAGFKGGEIVPTFCVGATFGCFMGASLGLPLELAAALGLIGLFCAVTGSPLASIFLSVELFGAAGIGWFIPLCIIAFAISNRRGLYSNKPCEIFTSILKEKYK